MKALVIYDTYFSNTEKIAHAISEGLGKSADVEVVRVNSFNPVQLTGLDVLVVGSPTRGFSPTSAIKKMLNEIPPKGLSGVKTAAFDTRFPFETIEANGFLNFMVKIFGYAAEPIANRLKKKKGSLLLPPEGFYVGDTEGPLLENEIERAVEWGKKIITA